LGFKEAVLHELQHAANWCRKPPDDCTASLCDEVKAYLCTSGANVDDPAVKDYIAYNAAGSAIKSGACKGDRSELAAKAKSSCNFSRDGCLVPNPGKIPDPWDIPGEHKPSQ
jgi:hypothetical protein